MSVRSQAQVQVNQTSDSPLQTGILQRSMGHEHSAELDAQPSLDTQLPQSSRFQQNFSRVSVRSSSLPFIQPKLKIGRPGDRYEQEADRVADQVMRIPNPRTAQSIQPVAPGHHSLLQRQPEVVEDKDEDEEEVVQTKPALGQTPSVTPDLQTQLHAGGGQALPQRTREAMESRFHHDFKGVRVHSDRHAANLNRQMHAQAFTHGQHIYFGQGYYQPSTFRGQHLLAHELTHVVQQTGGHTEGQIVQRLDLSEAQTGLGQSISVPSVNSTRPTISPTSINLQKQEEEGSILSDIASGLGIDLSQYLDDIPGYTLFTVIIEYDPIRGLAVERNAISLVQGLLGLLGPIGNNIFATLQEYEILQQAFAWIEAQLDQFNLSRERFARAINDLKNAAFDELPTSLGEVIQLFDRYVGSFARDVVAFTRSLIEQLIAQIKAVAIDFAEGLLDENPAWDLLKKVLHYDPLRGEEVEASTVEILTDFLMLIGKEQELEQMQERGTLQETADWLDTQLGIFLGLLLQLTNLFTNAWAAIQPENLPNLSANLEGLANQAVQFLQGLGEFALTIALKVLEIIKNALLALLREHANTIPGYHLITVMVEKDVFTQEEVPLTPTNLIHGFMSLIPGGEEQFQQMQETGVIPEAAQRIETAMTELGISWPFVRQLFLDIWDSFTIEDMVSPADTFARVLNEFSEPLGRLFTFVIEVIKVMLELVLVLMNFPTDLIGSIITNALQALDDIQRDPVGFLMNLIETMKLGFSNFFDNIVEHLIGGLADWLFSEVREAGIEPPADLTFESILGFVLDILGLSIDHLWELLAEHVGQETVDRIRGAIDRLAGAWSFIQDVQERGIVAVWEYIESQLNNLWDMVLAQVQDWTMERIIDVGMRWLLSLLDATGITPVINSAIAVFNAIQSAIEYLNEMLAVVNDFVSTVASIARGDIQPGAERMEQGLSNSLPIVIGFLANQFGLGDIGDRLQEIIAGARELVDAGLNWLIEQALRLGQAVLRSLGLGREASVEDSEAGVEGLARQTVLSQIGERERTREDVQIVVERVAEQLRPQGVKKMELSPPDEDGEYNLLVEASPLRPFLKMVPLTGRMRSVARVTVDDSGPELSWEDIEEVEDVGRQLNPATGKMESIQSPFRRITPPGQGQVKTGAAVILPQPSRTLHVVSRATGEYTVAAASSHAERYFAQWILNQQWKDRIIEITIENFNLNPCEYCGGALIDLINQLNRSRNPANKVQASLAWSAPWGQEDLPVIENTLSRMQAAGWNVNPTNVDRAKYEEAYNKSVAKAAR